jgi:hypothetical protein
MGTILLAILTKYWKWVLLGAIVSAAVGYVGVLKFEVGHYKKEVVALQLERDKAVTLRNEQETLAKQRANEITKAHADAAARENELIDQNNKLVKDKINANEELKRVKLSLNLVQLWNSSKQPQPTPAAAEQGNVGKADPAKTFDLSQLFTVSAENDANHLKCIKVVEEWQSFWSDYVKAKGEVDAISSRRAD